MGTPARHNLGLSFGGDKRIAAHLNPSSITGDDLLAILNLVETMAMANDDAYGCTFSL
jgi:hypothetical protein